MIFVGPFILHVKLGMMYTDDTRIASSNIIHHHKHQPWDTSGGKLGTLAKHRHTSATLQNFKV